MTRTVLSGPHTHRPHPCIPCLLPASHGGETETAHDDFSAAGGRPIRRRAQSRAPRRTSRTGERRPSVHVKPPRIAAMSAAALSPWKQVRPRPTERATLAYDPRTTA